jgi:MFS family permease
MTTTFMPIVKKTFDSLSERSFRNLWIGFLLQMGGMQMLMIGVSFYIYEITNSASVLGVVTSVSAIPAIVLALFGGVIADRMDKKRIIQIGQMASLLVALFIATLIATDRIKWEYFLVVSLIQGSVMPLMMPARQAIVPQLVGNARLMNAIALNAMIMSLTTMLAPALAGGLIARLGTANLFYTTAIMYAVSVYFTGLVPHTENSNRDSISVSMDMRDGIKYVFLNRPILLLILMAFSSMVLSMPIRFILPIFAKDIFLVGPEGLGYMTSAMGVGALVGSLAIAALGKIKDRGLVLVVTGVISGWIILGFSMMSYIVPTFLGALVFMAVIGLIQAARMTLNNSLMMENTDQEYRGRVMSILTLSMGLMPAGVMPVTLMSDSIGAPLALGVLSVLLIIVALLILVTSPSLRRLQ